MTDLPLRSSFRTLSSMAVLSALVALVEPAAPIQAEPAGEPSPVAAGSCDPGGLAPLLTPGRILLLGELHGTREGPAVVAAVACAALERSLPVAVFLEIPVEENDRLQQFLASDGLAEARTRLLAGHFWTREYQDGRSSVAMLGLIDDLRHLARSGGRLTVSLLDSETSYAGSQERDDAMGKRFVALIEKVDPAALIVSITGNVHSRSTPGTPWAADYRPAGIAVASRWPERTLSVLLANPPGTAWTCPDADAHNCGSRALGGDGGDDLRGAGWVELLAAPREGHRARFHLASLTASPPALAAP